VPIVRFRNNCPATDVESETPAVERRYTPAACPGPRVNTMTVAHIQPSRSWFILIPVLSLTGWGQSAAKPAVGAQFESVQSTFESEVTHLPKIRGENGYNSADVNAALKRTKEATLSPIPVQDKPLRSYVEQKFPQPVDEANDVVQKDEVDKRFSLVRELLAKLSHLDSFRLDLTVNTNPSKARFELVPRVGTSISSTTNSRLTNVYRGEYDYRITKAGFKPVRETINFIDRSGSILDCELQPDSAAEVALPCNFR